MEKKDDQDHDDHHTDLNQIGSPASTAPQQKGFPTLYRNNSFPGALAYSNYNSGIIINNNNNIGKNPSSNMTNFITHLTADGSESQIVDEDNDAGDDMSPSRTLKIKKHAPEIPPPSFGCRRTISAPTDENRNDVNVSINGFVQSQPSRQLQCEQQPTTTVQVQREPLKRKIIRRTLFAICIFFGQSFVSVALKRYGIIEKDMNQVMAEQFALPDATIFADFMPDIQALEMKVQETIESARLMTPGLNDTMYWLRLNNQLSQWQEQDGSTETGPTASVTITKTTIGRLRPGQKLAQKMKEEGGKRDTNLHPIVMIPGFVTSGLEVWQGKDCLENGFFRQRVWGGFASARYWLRNAMCMMKNLALDPITGSDPDGIKLRSAEGFNAADYFVGNDWFTANYWVWAKILENLADLGYDGSTMTMEAYDWRLDSKTLEERDGYLTHLKHRIEAYHKTTGQKCILISHSMGAIVVHYFLTWVTTKKENGGGGGGGNWVDKHIKTFVNIAGAQLGVAKAASALMSGEMSDTVILGALGSVVEKFIPRRARRDLWGSWGSLWSMYPKGGDGLWGIGADVSLSSDKPELLSINDPTFEKLFVFSDYEDYTNAPNDGSNSSATYEISCKAEELIDPKSEELVNKMLNEFAARQGNGVQESIDMLLTFGGGLGPGTSSQKNYAFSHNKERPSFRTWHDPSQTPLPNAPNLKIYSLYGIGAPTERSYFYRHNLEDAQSAADNDNQNGDGRRASDPPFILDTSVDDPGRNVSHGIRYADGDGSVPLLSLGYMTAGPWRDRKSGLNPSNCRSIIREYVHKPSFDSEDPLRKGRYSAEHVDILGNEEMMEDLVRIVSGYDLEAVDTDKIHSDINGIVQRVKNHPKGGLVRPRKW